MIALRCRARKSSRVGLLRRNCIAPTFLAASLLGAISSGWFPGGHEDLVAKAAKAMNLAVCKVDGEVLAELAKTLPPGRLYSTGRGASCRR